MKDARRALDFSDCRHSRFAGVQDDLLYCWRDVLVLLGAADTEGVQRAPIDAIFR